MAETPRKEDRRKERTRQLLRDALMELIVEKGYDAINIQDITERANVARPTFYLHFADKEELLFNSLREIYDDLVNRHMGLSREERIKKMTTLDNINASDFQHVAEFADFYQAMLSKKGSIAFVFQVLEYLQHVMGESVADCVNPPETQLRLPTDFVGFFMAGAQIGVTYWWLKHHPDYSPEKVAEMMYTLSLPDILWVTGLKTAMEAASD